MALVIIAGRYIAACLAAGDATSTFRMLGISPMVSIIEVMAYMLWKILVTCIEWVGVFGKLEDLLLAAALHFRWWFHALEREPGTGHGRIAE